MENKWKLSRRKFLIRAGTVGGIALGVTLVECGPLRRKLGQMANDGKLQSYKNHYAPDIWFEIAPDGTITLHSPKVEMGQGVFTALGQIAAEELETDWKNIRVVHAHSARGPVDPTVTGGSDSVANLYDVVRNLAAQMREMLKNNAAALLNVPASSLRADKGIITGGGKSISYGEVAAKSTHWEIPKDKPKLKEIADFKIIGQPLPRVDLVAKVKGEPLFGIDATMPGMLYGAVARPPFIGAVFKSAKTGKAETMPGVVKVVVAKEFVGVVAATRTQALDAKQALEINWEKPSKTWNQPDIEALIEVGKGVRNVIQIKGDSDKYLGGEGVLTGSFHTPIGAHAQMEPNGALVDAQEKKATIKMSTQVVQLTRGEVAKALSLSDDAVDVQPAYLGGGFGRRLHTPHAKEAAILSKAVGKPVHCFFERSEEFQNSYLRPPTAHLLKAKLGADGTIQALEHNTSSGDVAFGSALLPSFAPAVFGADFGAWRGGMIQYSAIPNVKTIFWRCLLPFATSWWRGLGLLANTFAIESFMDDLARAAKADPLEFRLKHIADDEAGVRLKGVLKAAAEKAGWGKPLAPGRAHGIACCTDVHTPVAQVVEAGMVNGKIKVFKVTCAIDPGLIINPDGVRAQCEGAIHMGMSAALTEEILIVDGKVTPNKLGYYNILLLRDSPEVEVVLLSTGPPRGVGEPPIGPIAAAIGNAVLALTGKRLSRIPLNGKMNSI